MADDWTDIDRENEANHNRLTALQAGSSTTRDDAYRQFRDYLESIGGRWDDGMENDFNNLWRQSAEASEWGGAGLDRANSFADNFASFKPRLDQRWLGEAGQDAYDDAGRGTGGTSASAGADWWSTNAPGLQSSSQSYGAAPEPFGETYTPLARPDHLRDPYVPPEFGETYTALQRPDHLRDPYVAPTWDETYAPLERPDHLKTPYEAPVFGETYTALERPEHLRSPYEAPTWGETFAEPTMEQVTADEGYRARLAQGTRTREASAAARGSILSGGTQRALERFGQEFASNEYGVARERALGNYLQRYDQFNDAANRGVQARGVNEVAYATDAANQLAQYTTRANQFATEAGLGLQARGINESAYQSDQANAYNAYMTRYGQFTDAANRGVQARGINESAYATDAANHLGQYNTRYGQFSDTANRALQARGVNESAYATDSANALGSYNTRYQAYQDAIRNTRDAERDRWEREYGLARLGLDATLGGRP